MISVISSYTNYINANSLSENLYVNDIKQTPFYMRPYILTKEDHQHKWLVEYKSQDKLFFNYFKTDINDVSCLTVKKLNGIRYNFMNFSRTVYKNIKINIHTYGGCLREVKTGKYLILTVTKNAKDFKKTGLIDLKDNSDIIVYMTENFFGKEYAALRKNLLPLFENIEVIRCSSNYIEETFFKNPLTNIKMENEEKFNKVLEKGNKILLDCLEDIETDYTLAKKELEYERQVFFRLIDANKEQVIYELSVCPYPKIIENIVRQNNIEEKDFLNVFNVFLNRYLIIEDFYNG